MKTSTDETQENTNWNSNCTFLSGTDSDSSKVLEPEDPATLCSGKGGWKDIGIDSFKVEFQLDLYK